MDSITNSFMLAAKTEYITRLSGDLTAPIMRDMKRMYEEAKKQHSNKALYTFQHCLKGIPTWNAGTIREKTAVIEGKCPWLSSLIAAVFVSFIKVMSSVRVSQDQRPNIRLKLPTNDAFIHQVYIEVARKFYESPEQIRCVNNAGQAAIIQLAIETTVRDQLPLTDILQAYLGQSVDDNGTMTPVLSPVHSDDEDEEAKPAADDSSFDRTAKVDDDAFSESSSSSDEEIAAHEPEFISVPPPMPAPIMPAPIMPAPMPAPMPAQVQHPHVQHPQAPVYANPMPHPQQLPQVPQVPRVPQAPQALFADAEDGHF